MAFVISLWEKIPRGTIQIAFTDASYAARTDFPETSGVYFLPKPECATTHLAEEHQRTAAEKSRSPEEERGKKRPGSSGRVR